MSSRSTPGFSSSSVLAALACLVLPSPARSAPIPRLVSPDGRIEVHVRAADRLSFDVLLSGRPLLQGSTLSLRVDGTTLGLNPRVRSARTLRVDRSVEPPVRQKAAKLRERYNQLRLELDGGYAVAFRAFDEGVAYRFETALRKAEVRVEAEQASLRFAGDFRVYFHQEESFFSHNERHYLLRRLSELGTEALASTPAVVDADGVKIAIADSDIEDYPGLWLKGTGGAALEGVFPPYPLEEKLERDRDFKVVRAADYIAVTRGSRSYPWRVLGIAERDKDLLTNAMVYLLAAPSRVADTSWIKPGKVAWDWWNANNIHGVDFEAGINTRTYEYYIDFAARHGLEYVILDEGWYELGDLLSVAPGMDIERLVTYGKQRGVGIIPWVVWKTLDDQFLPAMEQFQKWGVAGLKVDFMQRDDQKLMAFYHRVCAEAARRKLLLDFHGAIRPAHLTRTWPNLLSTEGVLGLEQFKWSDKSHPEHNVTLPFTRMFVGPFDYTPGAMRNASRKSFASIFEQPMSLGTRCQQLAMYVVFESPLQMLADSPSSYLREPESMEFLGPVPAVWDETRVLDARLGDYVAVARRSGRDWYVGAMTDATARELTLELDFLPEGAFRMTAWADGPNARRWASDYRRSVQAVTRAGRIALRLAEGGGFAARISPAAEAATAGSAIPGDTAAAAVEERVHAEVRAMLQAGNGRVLFTELWNGDRLSAAEREYAARLYEVFFALPAHVQGELRARGAAPSPKAIAANYGLAPEAVDLLLTVMTSEPRMPKLFRRDPETGALTDVDAAALENFIISRGSQVRVSGWKDKPLPPFSLPKTFGGTLASADFAGKPTLVYVWLTRCPVCRRVSPSVVELDRRLGPRGLMIAGLNADSVLGLQVSESEREAWLREQGVRYPNASLDAATRAAFGQNIFPAFFLVGRDGRVRELVLNERSLEELAALVEPLLQEPPPGAR